MAGLARAGRERPDEAKERFSELVDRFGETRAGGAVSIAAGYCVVTGVRG